LAFRQFWDPLLIFATIKVSDFRFGITSDLVYNLGSMSSVLTATFRTKFGGEVGLDKYWDLLIIFAAVEKFGTQLEFDECAKNNFQFLNFGTL